MKYKVNKGTALFDQLFKLKKRIDKVRSEAKRMAKKYGSSEFAESPYAMAGGIGGIVFNEKPEGWKPVGKSWQRLYYPKATNKQAQKDIGNLPTIDDDELNNILSFNPQSYAEGNGLVWARFPGVQWRKDYVLIEVGENCWYKPVKGMEEVTVSEYNKLKK